MNHLSCRYGNIAWRAENRKPKPTLDIPNHSLSPFYLLHLHQKARHFAYLRLKLVLVGKASAGCFKVWAVQHFPITWAEIIEANAAETAPFLWCQETAAKHQVIPWRSVCSHWIQWTLNCHSPLTDKSCGMRRTQQWPTNVFMQHVEPVPPSTHMFGSQVIW